MVKKIKCWRLTYRIRGTKRVPMSLDFFLVEEALEHVRLMDVTRFHLEDLTLGKVH